MEDVWEDRSQALCKIGEGPFAHEATRTYAFMKQRLSLLLALTLTTQSVMSADGSEGVDRTEVISVAKFKGDRAAAVSITLDDGLRNQDDVAVPLLNQYGIKATFFIIPGLTPETNEEAAKKKPGDWGGISWLRLKELAAEGHEIASHTWTHESVITTQDGQRIHMEPAKLEAQVARAYEAIKSRIGIAPLTFASPGNAIDEVIRAAAHKYHPVIRDQCERFGAWPPSSKDFTTEQANAMVDRYLAAGKPLVWMIHAITDGYNAQSSPAVLANHLKYLKSREEVLWLDTYANVKRYTMERDAAKLTQSITSKHATFTLECDLDQTQFHDPLTVVIPAKDAAQVIARSRNSGAQLPVEVRKDRIIIQSVPSPEPVEVTWQNDSRGDSPMERLLEAVPATAADVPYGRHPKQVLTFWKAASDKPTPLLFYIHGGGWTSGDRSHVGASIVKRARADGISVVSVEYRFVNEATADGVVPPVKGPMLDCARALQFVRSRATEWNLDKTRIAAMGRSAGGCTSLWLAFHNDLAEPTSDDPIARESTRLTCVIAQAAQTSLDPEQMRAWTPNSHYGAHAFDTKWNFDAFLASRATILPWIKEYSPYDLVSTEDPPVYLQCHTEPNMGKMEKDPTRPRKYFSVKGSN